MQNYALKRLNSFFISFSDPVMNGNGIAAFEIGYIFIEVFFLNFFDEIVHGFSFKRGAKIGTNFEKREPVLKN